MLKRIAVFAVMAGLLLMPAAQLDATAVQSSSAQVTVSVSTTESITVSVNHPSLTFVNGVGPAEGPLSVSYSYILNPTTRTGVSLYAFLTPGGSYLTAPGLGAGTVTTSIAGLSAQPCNQALSAMYPPIGAIPGAQDGYFCTSANIATGTQITAGNGFGSGSTPVVIGVGIPPAGAAVSFVINFVAASSL